MGVCYKIEYRTYEMNVKEGIEKIKDGIRIYEELIGNIERYVNKINDDIITELDSKASSLLYNIIENIKVNYIGNKADTMLEDLGICEDAIKKIKALLNELIDEMKNEKNEYEEYKKSLSGQQSEFESLKGDEICSIYYYPYLD